MKTFILILICLFVSLDSGAQSLVLDMDSNAKTPKRTLSFMSTSRLGIGIVNKRKIRIIEFDKDNLEVALDRTYENKKIDHYHLKEGYLGIISLEEYYHIFYLSLGFDKETVYKNVLTINKNTSNISLKTRVYPNFGKIYFNKKNRVYLFNKIGGKFSIQEYRSDKLYNSKTFDFDLEIGPNEVVRNNMFLTLPSSHGPNRLFVSDSSIHIIKQSNSPKNLQVVQIDLDTYQVDIKNKSTPAVPNKNENFEAHGYQHGNYLMQISHSKNSGLLRITDMRDQSIVREIPYSTIDEINHNKSPFLLTKIEKRQTKEENPDTFMKKMRVGVLSIIANEEYETTKVVIGSYYIQSNTPIGASAMGFSGQTTSGYYHLGLLFDKEMNPISGRYELHMEKKWRDFTENFSSNQGYSWTGAQKSQDKFYMIKLLLNKKKNQLEIEAVNY